MHVCVQCAYDIFAYVHMSARVWLPRLDSAAQFSCEAGRAKKEKKEREREGAREASFH